MSLADNSIVPQAETYQRQMTSYRRTRSAVMESARRCLQTHGYAATSMIDIADTAEVSRATLYNHFRDKTSVFKAFAIHELEQLFNDAKEAESQESALLVLSFTVSNGAVLSTLRKTDQALLTQLVSETGEPAWDRIKAELADLFGLRGELVLLWLVGQAFQPLSAQAAQDQIAQILRSGS